MSGGELSGDDKVLDLVATIYDAALEATLWPNVLNRIGDAVGGPHVMFAIYDPAIGLMNLLAPRIDPEIMRSDVVEHWVPRNPLLRPSACEPPGKVFTCANFIPLDEFAGTAFYQEWWRPAGFSTEPLVTNLFVDGAASGFFASHGLLNRAPVDSGQKRLFAALAQHLVRAVALQRRLYNVTIAREDASAGLDGLPQGFLLVDAQARILFANRAARALLDACDGLELESGILCASDADAGRTLCGLIASCADEANAATDCGGDLALSRGAARLPLHVLVTPVRPEAPTAAIPWALPQRSAAIVLISDPETKMRARVKSLRERFGFTPAEAAFALEIIKGDGRQATADRLGITVGTARSHLSKIFDKTGVRHQAELVRLLLDS
jgi:DNA-binding CsgD family transcriptional regulator/PAS domain-containing protein